MASQIPKFIIVHHTAGHDVPALEINKYHAERGFGIKVTHPKWLVDEYINRGYPKVSGGVLISIGYHYLIRKNGSIEKCRPNLVNGAHCKASRMNFQSLGVALTGNFDSQDNPDGKKGHMYPTYAQIQALRSLILRLRSAYGIAPKNVIGHREVKGAATRCPGDRFDLRNI